VSLVAPQAPRAVIDDRDPVEGNCALPLYNFKLQANLMIVGIPVAGSQVQVNATNAKLAGTKATATRICDPLLFPLTRFRWDVAEAPPGQSASILEGNTLSPRVALGGAGAYRIRLTACPEKCRLTRDGRSKSVGPFTAIVTIDAVSEVHVPPETEPPPQELLPLLRPQPPLPSFSYSRRKSICNGGGGIKDPQWATAQGFRGAGDYRLLEGPVSWSKVADLDNPLNHDSQDFEWKTKPDPPYYGLPHPDPAAEMKVEWETGRYPRLFQPTPGDRTSTFGFWIFDCGHDPFKAEIHPPVGVATERPRPVHIPPSFRPAGFPNGFGSNVHVPGIVTDIWFNRRSGELTRNCSSTGLHWPANGGAPGQCIREPHPLNRTFTFNVYLPRNPLHRARELGLNPPPVPLFIGTEKLSQGGGGAEPVTAVRERDGVTWLEVTLDLSTLRANEDTYARRISAAWAYPAPDNWGASRWRVLLKDMKIYDDSEPGFDDGDWRVFFNTNNRDQEWSKIIDCDGCVDDGDTRALNLRTGTPALGPHPVLFPGQPIFVHTVGYDDEVAADDLGTVFDRAPQLRGNYSTIAGGAATYRLNYEVRPAGSVGPAALTPEAGALSRAYTGRPDPRCTPTNAPTVSQVVPRAPLCGVAQQDPGVAPIGHPDSVVLDQRVLPMERLEMFEPMEREEFVLTDISPEGLRREVESLPPGERRELLNEIERELEDVPSGLRGDYNELVLTLDRALPPRLVRQAVPRGLRRSVRRFRQRGRALRRQRARRRARSRPRAAVPGASGPRVVGLTLPELPFLR
jgi:hypothetical protein